MQINHCCQFPTGDARSEQTIIAFHSDTGFKDTLYTPPYCSRLSTRLSAAVRSVRFRSDTAIHTLDSYSQFNAIPEVSWRLILAGKSEESFKAWHCEEKIYSNL